MRDAISASSGVHRRILQLERIVRIKSDDIFYPELSGLSSEGGFFRVLHSTTTGHAYKPARAVHLYLCTGKPVGLRRKTDTRV